MFKLVSIFFLLLASCYGGDNNKIATLTGKWRYDSSSLKVVVVSDTSRLPFLEFGKDGKTVSGFLGCNRFGAKFSTRSNEIKFTEMVQTEMACNNMDIENSLTAFLQNANEYKIENKKLYLLKSTDKTVVVFRKTE
jgi:heat shock protein HslJ